MKIPTQLLLLGFLSACTQADPAALCEPFSTSLEAVPHVALSVNTGEFVSAWDRMRYRGCEIDFETNDSLRAGVPVPDFEAVEGSEMYRLGWRMSEAIGADGAGTGIFGIERETVSCVIRRAQPSYVDDNGEVVQAETLSMKVQCRGM